MRNFSVMSSFRQPLTGKRFAAPTIVKGRKTAEGTESPLSFTASVQPLSPKELNALPEGERESAKFKLYTDFALRTVVTGDAGTNPDQVQINSEWYDVTGVDVWGNNVIPHYKVIVSKLG